jgi:hypothetical protein
MDARSTAPERTAIAKSYRHPLATNLREVCGITHSRFRCSLISPASVVTEITRPQEIMMSKKLKVLVVATLLVASASTAFAQRTPGQNTPSANTSQDSGPFENMSRPE